MGGRRLLLLMIIGISGCVGCGRPATTAAVRGRVTIKTSPLPGGLIRFHSVESESRWSGATIEGDGTYLVPDVPLGRCVVTIDTSNLKNLPAPRSVPGAPVPPGGDPSLSPQRYQPVAKHYATVEATPLKVEVKLGENVHDFMVD